MSATATYTVTMAELRGETQHGGNLWSNYGGPVQQMSGRYNPQDASGVVMPPGGGRPRSRHAMDYPPPPPPQQQQHHHQHAPQYHHRPPGPGEDGGGGGGGDPYDRYPHPSLMNIPSINSLKRSYSQVDNSPTTTSAPYTEMVQDLRDDYKPNAHDQKLLAFKKLGDKHTIVDGKGRIHEMEIDAQLHGMFFLSEFPAGEPGHPHPTSQHPQALNAELTCYRRNLFQISGSLCFPQIPLSVMLETGETSLIKNMEVSISAIESVDGHPVRLIVIPWKTPPPNAPDVNQAPDQEPPPLPLIPWSEEEAPEDNGGDHYAIYPIGWRRLQFRIATANNGRRKELQQHFVLHLKLHGTLANGQKLVLSELTTAPIVVRGRSPRNFQARKEIPLLGSSAGSRGQTLVETGHGIVAQAVVLNKPPYDSRPRVSSMEVPRSAFTFSAGKQLPQSPMQMRSNSYPTGTWNPQSQVSMPHNPTTSYPTSSLAGDPYQQKLPLSGAPSYSTEPQEMSSLGGHQQHATSMPSVQLSLVAQQDPTQPPPPIRTQFATYTSAPPPHISLSAPSDNSLNVPRYVDNNPRPSKSPRHASHQSIHSASSISADTTSGEYRYGPPTGYASVGSSELSPQSQSGGGGGPSQPTSAQQQPPSQQSQYPPPNPQQQDNNNNNNNNPGSAGGASNPGSAPQQHSTGPPPPRDYYPSSQSWTSTAGESPAAAYGATTAGDHRPYAYPPPSIKNEHGHGQHPGGGAGTTAPHAVPGGYGVPHYAWNAT